MEFSALPFGTPPKTAEALRVPHQFSRRCTVTHYPNELLQQQVLHTVLYTPAGAVLCTRAAWATRSYAHRRVLE